MNHPVAMLCRLLGISSSGYWAWHKREPSARAKANAVLTERIVAIHTTSRQTYGAPRVHADLCATGIRCGRMRVARLMRAAGIVGCHRRRHVVTTVREPSAPLAPDCIERQFVAEAPNTKWTADITYVPTWAGFLYLAVVLDVFSRRIVGWAMAEHLRTELVLAALDMALWNRRPDPGVIHHSDHGCQPGFKGSSQHWLRSHPTPTKNLSTSGRRESRPKAAHPTQSGMEPVRNHPRLPDPTTGPPERSRVWT